MSSSRWLCLCAGLLIAGLAGGCNGSHPARAEPAAASAGKIAPRLASAAAQLKNGNVQPPLTGPVRSDAAGAIQVYVHVTDTSAEHLAALGQHGLKNMLASPALRIVQGWIAPRDLTRVAALTFVTRITPPQYAIPR